VRATHVSIRRSKQAETSPTFGIKRGGPRCARIPNITTPRVPVRQPGERLSVFPVHPPISALAGLNWACKNQPIAEDNQLSCVVGARLPQLPRVKHIRVGLPVPPAAPSCCGKTPTLHASIINEVNCVFERAARKCRDWLNLIYQGSWIPWRHFAMVCNVDASCGRDRCTRMHLENFQTCQTGGRATLAGWDELTAGEPEAMARKA
jgi:hypothetical protein